uniref:AN1-type zinc finger protein 2B n=1 Tax=Lygus hesperus TaxID=30085 RepID=A0A0A9WHS0_LYGHE
MNKQYLDNVYSQVVNDAEEDYENDSFCVDSDDENSGDETTILELAERKLAKRKHSKKRIVTPGSDDSNGEDQAVDLESTAIVPRIQNKKKRRLLESDSDHTPDRVPFKRTRNMIVSPLEEETIPKTSMRNVISGKDEPQTVTLIKQKTSPSAIVKETPRESDPTLIRLESDSDEDLHEAIRRSVMETKAKTPEEMQFEEDLQKALLLSQVEVKGPSTFVRNPIGLNLGTSDVPGNPGPSGLQSNPGPSNSGLSSARGGPSVGTASQNLPPPYVDDGGTSFLFMSQPILKDRPFSTKPKVTNPSGPKNKKCNRVFELSDDSN